MKRGVKQDADQLTFAVFAAPTITPNGDGSVTIRPGKPMQWLTPIQFAQQFGRDRDTIYRWISNGLIDAQFVEPAGVRMWRIDAQAVDVVKAKLRGGKELWQG